ncbi:putative LRR receptor-like serine/threonine-protein kinase [Hordeum vulgare]|nr:putative LRR receptor-like serine/threonine-protein kinase [Hordeum vulgare]
MLHDFQPNDVVDERYLTHGLPFSTKNTYNLLVGSPDNDTTDALIWASRVPIKVQVFGWLLFQDRLNFKANLFCKIIVSVTICVRCSAPCEDTAHTFLLCSDSAIVCAALQLHVPSSIAEIWTSTRHSDRTTRLGLRHNPGRRYYACVDAMHGGCGYVEWHDPELPKKNSDLIGDLKDEVWRLRGLCSAARDDDECPVLANARHEEAISNAIEALQVQ